MRQVILGILIAGLCTTGLASAASLGNHHDIDLAEQAAGSKVTHSVKPGAFTVRIVNLAPKVREEGRYDLSFLIEVVPIEPLGLDQLGSAKGMLGACTKLEESRKSLAQATDESAAKRLVADVEAELEADSCDQPEIIKIAKAAVEATRYPRQENLHFTLRQGERLRVEVIRKDTDGEEEKRWTTIFTTGARGRWMTSYAFTFVRNEDERWVTREDGAGQFEIQRAADRSSMDFVPAVFFHWMPRSGQARNITGGLTAGLGFELDLDSPVVFLGGNLTYNHNISIVAGVAARKRRVLDERYEAGDLVAMNLETPDLHEDKYDPAFFAGVAFRFGSNPFKTQPDDNE